MDRQLPQAASPPRPFGWHALDTTSVLDKLASDGRSGLSSIQARRRLRRYGANLPAVLSHGSLVRWRDLKSPMSVLSLAAGLVMLLLNDWRGAGPLLALPLVGLGAQLLLALKTERHRRHLRQRLLTPCMTVRDASAAAVDPVQLVPGDLLDLTPGTRLWADARVLEAERLTADESVLHGPTVTAKGPAPVKIDTDRAEQSSMCWCGTSIISGRGRAVVVATGPNTFWSRRPLPPPPPPVVPTRYLFLSAIVLPAIWCARSWLPVAVGAIVLVLMAVVLVIEQTAQDHTRQQGLDALARLAGP